MPTTPQQDTDLLGLILTATIAEEPKPGEVSAVVDLKKLLAVIKARDEHREREIQADIYGQWRNTLEGRVKQAKSFNEPTAGLESDLKMVNKIFNSLTLTQPPKEATYVPADIHGHGDDMWDEPKKQLTK